MWVSLCVVIVLCTFLCSHSTLSVESDLDKKSGFHHPWEVHQRRAQEIAFTFISQLNANQANATELRALLENFPEEDVRVFELAAMSFDQSEGGKKAPAIFSSFPVAHHLLNQFMLAKSAAEKTQFLELISLALSHGADAFIPLNNDPPLYHKALMLKNLSLLFEILAESPRQLANEIIARSANLAALIRQLYAVPAEVVPIAKLLLHVEKLTHRAWDSLSSDAQREREREAFNATAVAEHFLSLARLERPSFSAAQLLRESARYRALVAHVASFLSASHAAHNVDGALETSKVVSLADITQALSELALPAQRALLNAVLSLEERERRWTAAEHLLDLHVLSDERERNALHALAAANAFSLLDSLGELFQSLWDETTRRERDSERDSERERETARDRERLRAMAALLLQGFEAVDLRGHTPLSYAETRFGAASDVALTVRAWIARLLRVYGGDWSVFDAEQRDSEREQDVEVSLDGVLAHSESEREVEASVADEVIESEAAAEDEGQRNESDDKNENESESESDAVSAPRALRSTADGGWSTARLSLFDEKDEKEEGESGERGYGRCDVLEIFDEALPSDEEFFARFVNTATPVVFRGAALRDDSAMRRLRDAFQKKEFVRVYGKVPVTASSLPYADSFGVQSTVKTLKEVANSDTVVSISASHEDAQRVSVPLYTFTTASPQWAQRLHKDVPLPEPLQSKEKEKSAEGQAQAAFSYELQFYLGPAGTGAPVHFHGHAINTLAYGEKKWVLYPPEQGFYTTIAALDFFRMLETYNHTAAVESLTSHHTVNEHVPDLARGSLQCTQYAGDIFYLPTMWAHGTLNVQQSIGVAHEFSVESFCME